MSALHTKERTVPLLHRNRRPPGSGASRLVANARQILRDPLQFLTDLTRTYGDIAFVRFLVWPIYVVNHPDFIKQVLQEHHRSYNKDNVDYRLLRPLLGKGLLTNDGAPWLHQRRLIQPTFHRQRLAAFGSLMTEATEAMLERWERCAERGEVLDVAAEMMRLTLRIIGQALFSLDLSEEATTVGQALRSANDYLRAPFPPLFVPTPRNRRLQAALRRLDALVYDLIATRWQSQQDPPDLLSVLLAVRDEETGEGMDDRQVRDEVVTLLLAGHETTAVALCWTWYLLAQHQECEQLLHAEVDAVLGGRLPTVEDLPRLPYCRMVIKEALRLYPPAWSFSRNAVAQDELGGYAIAPGSMILLCPYTTHRHPALWEQPEAFDPLRFTPERVAARPHYAYFPFGGGPRLCVGLAFAMMEAHLILATVAQRFRLRLGTEVRIDPEPLVTLRPRGGLPMLLAPRPGRDERNGGNTRWYCRA
jgi:cytochrome P450